MNNPHKFTKSEIIAQLQSYVTAHHLTILASYDLNDFLKQPGTPSRSSFATYIGPLRAAARAVNLPAATPIQNARYTAERRIAAYLADHPDHTSLTAADLATIAAIYGIKPTTFIKYLGSLSDINRLFFPSPEDQLPPSPEDQSPPPPENSPASSPKDQSPPEK